MKEIETIDLDKIASLNSVCISLLNLQDDSVRDFMLTNLVHRNGQIMWRVNIDAMLKYFRELGRIPEDKPPFTRGPTLFIGGSLSDYIT